MELQKEYPAKILLFGEYTLMKGSAALSIPFREKTGSLKFLHVTENNFSGSHNDLKKFYTYLKNELPEKYQDKLLLEQFKKDIEKGIVFKSDIPLEYGMGSSGALVASVYARYSKDQQKENIGLEELKDIFSAMESFFHGKSSGLDPLVSYLNRPVLIDENGKITTPEPINYFPENIPAFLIDSRQTGETQPLVDYFIEQSKNPEFKYELNNNFIPLNRRCIDSWYKDDANKFFNAAEKLSSLTLKYFKPMIPSSFMDIWEKGLKEKNYFLKLCGSGGGGMILGFSMNPQKTKTELKNYSIYWFNNKE